MSFITQGKTNWKFLVIVAVLAVIVGGGILLYMKSLQFNYQIPEIKKLENVVKDETADWQTYKNDNFIKFKYPSDWKIKDEVKNNYGRGVLSIELFSPDYKRNENLEVIKGYTIFIIEEYHAYCYLREPTDEQLESDFCTSPIPIETAKGPDPQCMQDARVIDIKNGKAISSSKNGIKGYARIIGNEGSLYEIGISPEPKDKEAEELFSFFINSFEILPFVSFENFFFKDLKTDNLYQKVFAGLTGDWKYGAYKINSPNVNVTARVCGKDVEKVDFYYSLKESPQNWQLIGSGNLKSNQTDWKIEWKNIQNNNEMYIMVKIYKNNLEFQSLQDKVFSSY